MNNSPKQSILDVARSLAEGFTKHAAESDQLGKLHAEDVRALRESGYLAISVPRSFGGQGMPLHDCVAAHLELSKGSASLGLLAAMTVQIFGSEREYRQWSEVHWEALSCAVAEGGLFNTAASEPRLGSPARGQVFATTARSVADGYQIDGHKTWITGGQHLTDLLVRASLEGIPALLLVPAGTPGVRWEHTWAGALSLRASESDDLYLENVVVPPENLILHGDGEPGPNAWFPMLIAATYLGVGLAARDAIIRYALERVPTALGRPIATLPSIQRCIGEIDLALQAAVALLLDVAAGWPADPAHNAACMPRVVAAKQFAAEAAAEAAQGALRIAGGAGISSALPFERLFRDAQAGASHPPSGDMALEIVGRSAIDGMSEGGVG